MTSYNIDKEEYWQRENSKIAEIMANGMAKYAKQIVNTDKAFKLKDHSLRCIDEGTPGGVHCAGSGILLDASTIKQDFHEADLDGVYSHAECGAAKLYAEQENLDPAAADEYGIEWAKALAEKLGVPYKGHIDSEILDRPSGLHTARVVYYDGTGRFDPTACPELPQGFVISRRFLDPAYALKEVEVAAGIAFSSHGFGDKFNQERPLLIVAVGDSGGMGKLLDELPPIAEKYGSRVKIDRLATPG